MKIKSLCRSNKFKFDLELELDSFSSTQNGPAISDPIITYVYVYLQSTHVVSKGVELNLVRGGIIILACARRERKFHPPPLSEFSPPGLLFAPSGHTFSFFSLYIVRMAMSSDGELPPLRSSARGTSPFPPLNMMSDIIQGLSDNLCKNCIFLAT